MKRVSVVGATGYSGAELTVILARHAGAEVAGLYASSGAGASYGSLHPALRGRTGPGVEPFSVERVLAARPDAVFLATPNELSAEVAGPLLDGGATVVDLAGAFRLTDPAAYPRWYGFAHPRPDLLAEAVYGLTELAGASLAGARLVANPGCYPTSVILALSPLLPFLAPGAPIVCDSASGVSGAGKKSELAFSFSEVSGSFKAYGVGTHRHEPEMRQQLGLPEEAPFTFVAHLLPVVRGILSTMHVTFSRPVAPAEVAAAYEATYGTARAVRLLPAGSLPELKDAVGTPRADIGFVLLAGGTRAVVVSAIDNLLKGAASQAVQNFNRVFGFDEMEGLL